MSRQREMSLMGQTIRPMQTHPEAIIGQCKTIGAAIGLAMTRGGFDQGGLAERVNCSRGYINLIISGKRPCTERMAGLSQPPDLRAWGALYRKAVADRAITRLDNNGWSKRRASPCPRYRSLICERREAA